MSNKIAPHGGGALHNIKKTSRTPRQMGIYENQEVWRDFDCNSPYIVYYRKDYSQKRAEEEKALIWKKIKV